MEPQRTANSRTVFRRWRSSLRFSAAIGGCLALVSIANAQQQSPEARLRAEQSRLEQLRRERAELEGRMRQLRGTVHDLSAEVANLDRQDDRACRALAGVAAGVHR
jgi:chromosome segregation ATPase